MLNCLFGVTSVQAVFLCDPFVAIPMKRNETQHFPFVILHNHVIMPNHVHGIIEIAKNNGHVSPSPKSKFGPQSKNLASIIRGFKIGVTKSAKNIDPNWGWQPRFHDHIIRNYKSFQRISNYITTNPTRWKR